MIKDENVLDSTLYNKWDGIHKKFVTKKTRERPLKDNIIADKNVSGSAFYNNTLSKELRFITTSLLEIKNDIWQNWRSQMSCNFIVMVC